MLEYFLKIEKRQGLEGQFKMPTRRRTRKSISFKIPKLSGTPYMNIKVKKELELYNKKDKIIYRRKPSKTKLIKDIKTLKDYNKFPVKYRYVSNKKMKQLRENEFKEMYDELYDEMYDE